MTLHQGAEPNAEETLMPKKGGVVGGVGEETGGLARGDMLSILSLVNLVEEMMVYEPPLGIQWRGATGEESTPGLGRWGENAQGERVVSP